MNNLAEHSHLAATSMPKVVINNRQCGDLFELVSFVLPPQSNCTHKFSPHVNLLMMVKGSTTINQKQFELQPGQVWLAQTEHCELQNSSTQEDAVAICVMIKTSMLTRFYDRYDQVVNSNKPLKMEDNSGKSFSDSPIIFPSCDLTRLTLESFRLLISQHDDGLNTLKLEELLLLKLKGEYGDSLASEMRNGNNPVQEKFRRFMEKNVTQNWSVAMYAKNFGMSLTSFKAMFSKVYYAQSPKAWINQRRLRHADVLLRTSDKRIVDIALDCGFSSQSYFTQMYKAHFGISPMEARQQS